MEGLNGIFVVVEDLGPELKGQVTRREIRTQVESRLKIAGIPIFKKKDAAKTAGEPYLYVNIGALPLDEHRFACRMDLEIHQLVSLVHHASQGHATTWEAAVITVGTIEEIRECLDDLVFDFIYDFLSVNSTD